MVHSFVGGKLTLYISSCDAQIESLEVSTCYCKWLKDNIFVTKQTTLAE